MKKRVVLMSAACVVLFCTTTASGDDRWPQFRGPGALGVSDEPGLPETWSTTQNVDWVTAIEGLAWNSPIVWDDTVFLTSVVSAGDVEAPRGGLYLGGERRVSSDEHRWVVYGIDVRTGAIKWEREVHRGVPATSHHLKNTLRVGDSRRGRRARVRVFRQRGPVLSWSGRPAAVVRTV